MVNDRSVERADKVNIFAVVVKGIWSASGVTSRDVKSKHFRPMQPSKPHWASKKFLGDSRLM